MPRSIAQLVATILTPCALVGCGHFGADSLSEFEATQLTLALPQSGSIGNLTLTLARRSHETCGPLEDEVSAYVNGTQLTRGSSAQPGLLRDGSWTCPSATFYGPASALQRAPGGLTRIELVDGRDSIGFTVRDAGVARRLVPLSDLDRLAPGAVATFRWTPATDRIDPRATPTANLHPEAPSDGDIGAPIELSEGNRVAIRVPADTPPGRYQLWASLLAQGAVDSCSLERCSFPVSIDLEQPVTVVD